jgi:hypothetical protein
VEAADLLCGYRHPEIGATAGARPATAEVAIVRRPAATAVAEVVIVPRPAATAVAGVVIVPRSAGTAAMDYLSHWHYALRLPAE